MEAEKTLTNEEIIRELLDLLNLSATGEEVAAVSAEGMKISDSTVESMKKCKMVLNNIYELADELKVSVDA